MLPRVNPVATEVSRVRLPLFLVFLAAATLSATTASASVRLAAPDGVGGSPCNPTPCNLAQAVSGAVDGDQVELAAGTYSSASDLLLSKAIEVGGQPGAGPSIAFSGAHGALVKNSAATLHDVRLSLVEPTMASALQLESGTVERVYADGSNGLACSVASGTIRDSVCFGGLSVTPSGLGKFTAAVRNVTADPLLIGAFEGAGLKATVVNTIAQPSYGGGSGDSGLLIDVSAGSSAAVTLTNSNYASVDSSLSSGTNFTFTAPGTNGNQTAPAQFVDGPGGDFRQLETSPTVDAGLSEPLLGAYDIEGALRSQPRCIGGSPIPDIGAYELTSTVPCSLPPAPDPNSNFRFGKLKRNLAKGTATLKLILPGPGKLVMRGKGLVGRQLQSNGAKPVKLLIKAKGATAKKLRRKGKLKVRPIFSFTPTGGAPLQKPRPLLLRRRPSP